MDGLFTNPRFTTFGPSRYDLSTSVPLQGVTGARPKALRQAVRDACPARPGVYGMVDDAGELIYVGKAKALRARLLSYFRTRSRDPKAGRILRRVRAIVWEFAPSEFAALLRELELIRRWRPRFNVAGQPRHRRWAYVCLGRKPAPYLFVTRKPPAGTLACFGPVSTGRRTHEAVRWLNDAYRLRDCPQAQQMIFADQAELFPVERAAGCLRLEIGTCLGPCAAVCTRAAYAKQARAALAFLDGSQVKLLAEVKRAMTAASATLAYERAAALRDKLEAFQGLHGELDRLRVAREQLSFVYPVPGFQNEDRWYLIERGQVVGVVPVPRDPPTCREAARAVEAVYLKPDVRSGTQADGALDTVLLVAAWFRRFGDETQRALRPADALALCAGRALTMRRPTEPSAVRPRR